MIARRSMNISAKTIKGEVVRIAREGVDQQADTDADHDERRQQA